MVLNNEVVAKFAAYLTEIIITAKMKVLIESRYCFDRL